MIFYRYGEFNDDFLKNAIEDLNNVDQNDSEIFIHLDSSGGDSPIKDHLVSVLRRLSKDKTITIVFANIESSAFDLVYNLKDLINIEILDGAFAIIHKIRWKVSVADGGTLDDVEKYKMEYQKNKGLDYDFLTSQEKEKYERGEDVVLGEKRLYEIFGK